MPVAVSVVMQVMEKIAPKSLAYDWDNVGLLIGDPSQPTERIIFSLDINDAVVTKAIEEKANLIITHHPVIFKPLKNLRWDEPLGALLKKILANNISVYSAHTNLDRCADGVNGALVEALEISNGEFLRIEGQDELVKIIIFVPASHEMQVKKTLGDEGAGCIGNYSHCSFSSAGTGSFRPLDRANPYIGQRGILQEVEEVRVETIVPRSLAEKVLSKVALVHPYEEMAYDMIPLLNVGQPQGLGMVGELNKEMVAEEFMEYVKEKLGISVVKCAGVWPNKIRKVAVCGGSGGSLISAAARKGAQILITGDVGYHQAQEAMDCNIVVVDAGHAETERIVLPYLAKRVSHELETMSFKVNCMPAKKNIDYWDFY